MDCVPAWRLLSLVFWFGEEEVLEEEGRAGEDEVVE